MRVALFSDVHGNAVAFDAFLADLERQAVDRVVCLGDHALGGAQPAECLEQLRELGAHGLGVEFRRVPFDSAEVVRAIEGNGMPHPESAARFWRR